jgi:hypothetical protein
MIIRLNNMNLLCIDIVGLLFQAGIKCNQFEYYMLNIASDITGKKFKLN